MLGLIVVLLIIAVIVYFVMTSEDEGTDETPSPEETTSMWEGEPGAAILLADAGNPGAPPVLILRSA